MSTRDGKAAPAARAARGGLIVVLLIAPVVLAMPSRAQDTAPTPNAEGCVACHRAGRDIRDAGAASARRSTVPLSASAHTGLACIDCHPALRPVVHADIQQELASTRASCVRCHADAATRVAISSHGREASGARPGEKRPTTRPTCVTCHGAHGVLPTRSRGDAVTMARVCSGCHVERGVAFFERNYHGKEAVVGRDDVAFCADCHGGHLVLPASDPRSTVSLSNVLSTCRDCHQNATKNFGDIRIHVLGVPLPSDPGLRAATLYMVLVVAGTFAVFGAHTVLGILHAWRHRGRQAHLHGEA